VKLMNSIDSLNAGRARKGIKPAVRKYPSKGDASGRMSQQKPNLRGKMIKPAKPGAKSGAVKKPYKMVPAVKPTPKAKSPKMIPAVKPTPKAKAFQKRAKKK